MDESITTEIKDILQQKIKNCESPFQEEGWLLLQYSDPKDFQKLWKIRGNGIGEDNDILKNDKIFMIWDGFPEDNSSNNGYPGHNVNLSYYITPIDWALAYSCKCVSEMKAEIKEPVTNCKPASKIVILDMCSHEGHLYKGDKVKNFHLQALEAMQAWVKFYSFNKMLYGDVCCSPLEITSEIEFKKQGNQQRIRQLSEEWYQILRDIAHGDNTHHTINNILDPIQLAELTLEPKNFQGIYNRYPIHTKAFYQSLKWHGKIAEGAKGGGKADKIDNLDLEGARVVLVDDHAKHGWEDLLNYWIYPGGPGRDKKIESETDPKFIIEKIEQYKNLSHYFFHRLVKNGQYQKERFKLHFTESEDEILVFDLYLYPLMSDEEIEYFKNVIGFAEGLEVCIEGLTELKAKLEDEEYRKDNRIAYLTLLPRLIAEINPSIPIIIFSSSEQDRDLSTEGCLGKYHSIDVFTKPAVFSYIDSNKIRDQQEAESKRNNFRSRLYV